MSTLYNFNIWQQKSDIKLRDAHEGKRFLFLTLPCYSVIIEPRQNKNIPSASGIFVIFRQMLTHNALRSCGVEWGSEKCLLRQKRLYVSN